MSHRSLATKKDIRIGKRVWIHSYSLHTGQFKVKSVILRKHLKDFKMSWVEVPGKNSPEIIHIFGTEKALFMDDLGVRGMNYDNRPCQVFLTKRSAEYWANQWKGGLANYQPCNY